MAAWIGELGAVAEVEVLTRGGWRESFSAVKRRSGVGECDVEELRWWRGRERERARRHPVNRAERVCDVIDRIISGDVSGRGVVSILYEAAREKEAEPLTLRAAQLLSSVPAGRAVILATGWPHRPHVASDVAETDGPPGAAVLARTLSALVGAIPVFVVEEVMVQAMEAVARATGLRPVAREALLRVNEMAAPLRATCVLAMPVEMETGRQFARDLFESLTPAAVVVVEKGGLNGAGRVHTSRGHDTTSAIAKADLLVEEARRRGVPTIAVGDGGNEVGMGVIKETVRSRVPYGERCQCPCQGGIAPEQVVDCLVVAAVSNWGAYGVGAAISVLKGCDWPHDVRQEARVLEAAASAGLCDGPTGWVGPMVDALPLEVHQSIVTLLGEVVRKSRWTWG